MDVTALLQRIEDQQNVQIVYAHEMGSRVWGWASETSDHDVRFIYLRPIRDYFAITPLSDTISFIDQSDDGIGVDAHGWDITKFARLIAKSNPSAVEWMHTPIVYREDAWPVSTLRTLSRGLYAPYALYQHYYGMAHGHFHKYIQTDETIIDCRKYFHILRALYVISAMSASWNFPPLAIQELLETTEESNEVCHEILELIERRRTTGTTLHERNPVIERRCAELFVQFAEPQGCILQSRSFIDDPAKETMRNLLQQTVMETIIEADVNETMIPR